MPQSGILIDGFITFDKFPRDSAVEYYFLTHAHSDHYGTIDNKWNNGTIYCSPITAHVLPIVTHRSRSKHAGISSQLIHPLDLNVWHHMNGFSVMLLDANHIPGSVMFLFLCFFLKVLFIGNFRTDIRLYQNIFAMSVCKSSSAKMCHLLHKFFFNDSKPVTIMVPKVGREQLLVDIAMEFKCKIWVDYVRFQIAEILGLNEYFTTEKAETSIWTCTRQSFNSEIFVQFSTIWILMSSMPLCYGISSPIQSLSKNKYIFIFVHVNERMRYIEYSDHSSPNEIHDFLSQLSFTHIIGLIGLACDHALRSAFDIEILQGQKEELSTVDKSRLEIDKGNTNVSSDETILKVDMPRNIENTGLSDEIAAKSDEKLQKAGQEIKKNAENLLKAIGNEDDYSFNLIVREITRAVNVENLATHICMELNNSENEEKDNFLHEFLNEMGDVSKEVESLGSFGEQYREAVNSVAKMQTVHDKNVPYNAQEHVVYDISRAPTSINIPLEWLNESEKTDESIIIELE
ncbi:hypothetical protein X798_05731 [Onchocerca flexuosa]|uniref:Metallo-beta-lactamase domain-containing protein n=1 Tax=Onchocerca flexuosa TaxID=387005 RepID=A0A238BPS6_9BILA|nr:hypothetical protein X798_05731 [Onchocerca flexuosa]